MNAAVALTLLIALSPALAESNDTKTQLTKPPAGLRLVKRSDTAADDYLTIFKGKLTLTGMLVVTFFRTPRNPDENDTTGQAYFMPDLVSKKRLPHAVGQFYPSNVDEIWLKKDPIDFLVPLIGDERAKQVLQGNSELYSFPAQITISEFATSIACDTRNYQAVVQTITSPKIEIAGNIDSFTRTC